MKNMKRLKLYIFPTLTPTDVNNETSQNKTKRNWANTKLKTKKAVNYASHKTPNIVISINNTYISTEHRHKVINSRFKWFIYFVLPSFSSKH